MAFNVVVARDKHGSFGLLVTGSHELKQGIFLTGVVPNTPAADLDLDFSQSSGWRIISVDGVNMTSAGLPDLQAAIAHADADLSLVLEPPEMTDTAKAAPLPADAVTITLRRHSRSTDFGIGLVVSPQQELFVSDSMPGSPAAAVPELAPGLQVLALQGRDMSVTTSEEVRQIQRNAGLFLAIAVVRNPDGLAACGARGSNTHPLMAGPVPSSHNDQEFTATLERNNGSFGLALVGAPENDRDAVFIAFTHPHSPAALHAALAPRVSERLQVLAINGTDTRLVTLATAVALVAQVDTLVLRLCPNPLAYARVAAFEASAERDAPAASTALDWGVTLRPASSRPARPSFVAVAPLASTVAPKITSPQGPSVRSERTVALQRWGGESLGLMIRGGSEMGPGVGIYVSHVDAGSVAARAGVKAGDLILSVNGIKFVGP